LISPKQQKRLRHTDRLMRGQQRCQVSAVTPEQHRRTTVVRLRQTEPAKLRRNLDAKRTKPREPIEHVLRDLTHPIDLVRIHLLMQKRTETREEGIALVARLVTLLGK